MATVRCEPCSLGNHSGTNGTPGCEGGACSCSCRPPGPGSEALPGRFRCGCTIRAVFETGRHAEDCPGPECTCTNTGRLTPHDPWCPVGPWPARPAMPVPVLPMPWWPMHARGQWGVYLNSDTRYCVTGRESEARSMAHEMNRQAARKFVDEQQATVAAKAVEWLERRDEGELGADDSLGEAVRYYRAICELYERAYPTVDLVL